jgi:uncharacterized repeat protein (TIGR01451 family)
LAITQTSNPTNLLSGTSIVYSIDVMNLGTVSVSGVSVTDSIPAGVTFLLSIPAPSETNGSEYGYDLGFLSTGAVTSIMIEVSVTSSVASVLTNWVSVFSTNLEAIVSNNSASAVTLIPDSDGDGVNNPLDLDDDNDHFPDRSEYIANTDSLDPASYFWVQIAQRVDQRARDLSFLGSTGRVYRIERSTNLFAGPWVEAHTNILGLSGLMIMADTNDADRLYYRVGVEMP